MERPSVDHLIAQAAEEQWEELDLSGMDLVELPEAIASLGHLKRLILGKWDEENQVITGNQLTTLPAAIGQLQQLEELHLCDNKLTAIPEAIAPLTKLTKLELAKNQIREIPDWISNFLDLNGLSLWQNQITVIPDALANLSNLSKLNLGGNQISVIPDWLGTFTDLTELSLGENQITVIPHSLANLANLTKLTLYKNQITVIPEWLGTLTSLTELRLEENQLTVIPDALANLTNLSTLNLRSNQITVIPDWLGTLTSLTELSLWENQITVIPDALANLSNLSKLNLGGNKISVIPDWLGTLTRLTELYLWGNQLTVIPDALSNLTNLTKLYLNKNQITFIPDWIGRFTSLMELSLWGNQIMVIPDALANLAHLSKLDLGRNQITVIPDWIGRFTSLMELSLWENQLTVIPDGLANLTNLSKLKLYRNQITVIADWIGTLTSLTELRLGGNQITVLPDSLANLANLSTLNLGNNQITVIPDWIGTLTSLTELSLWGNQITVIPDALAHLTNLTMLDLYKNQIAVIPDWIDQLGNLKTLDMAGNLLREVPPVLTWLDQLELLRLEKNPLSIPPETLRQGWGKTVTDPGDPSAILNYCRNTRDPNHTQTRYEVKLLLVGEGGSGKTSLANKLLNPDYRLKPEAEDTSTKGIDILKWEFTGQNGQPYRINLWDFGGQEIYHQTHQFFLTERSLYLLVADSRKEDTDHYFWLKSIQVLSNDSPVLLVQNEKQDRECNLNLKQLRGEFENLKATHRLNLADNRGLPELQQAIQHELEKLLPQGIVFPNKWLAVRYALENDGLNYIDCTAYEDTCRRHGIRDRREMFQLSQFLHDLGICLHFQTDALLRHYLILKPNWGTAAVYKILDNDTVRQNRGQFSTTNLEEIWAASEYANVRGELLQLMKAFKVCYEIPRRKGQYIAPHLLSADSPPYDWPPQPNLILSYRYPGFMPKGILTRFIVEMHQDIENVSDPEHALVWKSGVVLASNGARAQVIESYAQRQITIRVSGNRPRDLLTIINRKFQEIHDDFDDRLAYDTLIPCNCSACKQTQTPFTFPLDRLHQYIDKGWPTIHCQDNNEQVTVRSLIDGVINETDNDPDGFDGGDREDFSGRPRRPSGKRWKSDRPPRDQPTFNVAVTVPITNANQQEQTMPDPSPKIQNFNGPMSGVIASDNASVTDNTFTQTNNANTTELLNLITTLRQTATQFPADIQEGVIIDLEDLETEIQKPADQRSIPRLKRSLIALLGIAGLIATPVAGMTDFTNNVLEIGNKLHIELPKLP